MVYINYLSTHCAFIYLLLKILLWLVITIEIKKKKETDLPLFKHGAINYLSTHCAFIYLLLKILTLLPTNYKPGKRKHFRKLKFRKVNLFLRVNISG